MTMPSFPFLLCHPPLIHSACLPPLLRIASLIPAPHLYPSPLSLSHTHTHMVPSQVSLLRTQPSLQSWRQQGTLAP